MNLAFLSRGHGYGHAARDLHLIEALRAARPGLTVDLMSSGSGYEYFKARSVPCTDMGIPDAQDMTEAAKWTVWRHLAKTPSPWDLVVADEVVWALPFARRILRVPAIALTDWFFADFGRPDHDRMFDSAHEVVVLDFEQSHPQPARTTAPVHFAGPVVREFGARREQARTALGLAQDTFAAVLTLGGMPDRPEAVRMLRSVLNAWAGRPDLGRRLFVLGELSADTLGALPGTPPDVLFVGGTATPDLYYCAADVTLFDAMGFTGCELAFNGRRAIGLIDPEAVAGFPESFRRRLAHMQEVGWIETALVSTDAEELGELIAGAGRGAAQESGAAYPGGPERLDRLGRLELLDRPERLERPERMPAADLRELAERILRHAQGETHD